MNKIILTLIVGVLFLSKAYSQNDASAHSLGISIGPSWALTDLGGSGKKSSPFIRDLDLPATKFGFGVFYRYTINEWVAVRANLLYGMLHGSDEFTAGKGNKTFSTVNSNTGEGYYRRVRNLDFKTHLFQFNALAEVNLKKYDPAAYGKGEKSRWAPYIGGGVGMFFFNPFTKTFSTSNIQANISNVQSKNPGYITSTGVVPLTPAEIASLQQYEGTKIKLRKLNTSQSGTYSPISFNLTGILGMKFNITDVVSVFFEGWYNQTFTDNLDDVNGNYHNYNDYLTLSPLEKAMSVRYFELPTSVDPTGYYGVHSIWGDGQSNLNGNERGDDNVNDAKGTNDQFFSILAGVSIRLSGNNRNKSFGCGMKNPYNHKFSCPKW